MVAESEAFAEQDEELRKKIEARNALENCQPTLLLGCLVFESQL